MPTKPTKKVQMQVWWAMFGEIIALKELGLLHKFKLLPMNKIPSTHKYPTLVILKILKYQKNSINNNNNNN